jgi:hypothetical protein
MAPSVDYSDIASLLEAADSAAIAQALTSTTNSSRTLAQEPTPPMAKKRTRTRKKRDSPQTCARIAKQILVDSGLLVSIDHGEDEEKKRMQAHKFLAVAQAVKLIWPHVSDPTSPIETKR